jgi:HSP20 family protein
MGSFHDSTRRQLAALSDEMQRMLDEFLACKSPANIAVKPVWRPATDVYETEKHIVIRMDIAGMNEKDIGVALHPNSLILRISGRRVDCCPEPKIGFSQMEVIYGTFQRDIQLPRGINPEGITRSYANGMLEILIPKAQSVRSRKITITVRK